MPGNILQIKVPGFVQYEWSTGSRLNMISISRPDKYRLRVRDRNGCYGKDSVTVDFINCVNIQMPNAFTPNGDNLNDDFKAIHSFSGEQLLFSDMERLGRKGI